MNYQLLYKDYIDQYGLVQPQPHTTSDNGVRFSAEAFLACWEKAKWMRTTFADESQVKFCLDLAVSIGGCTTDGLIERYPGCTKQEGPDDYIAALAVSYLTGSKLAERIYDRGVKHIGFYCNDGFRWNAFLWRNFSLAAFSRYCAKGSIGLLGQIIIAISLVLAGKSESQDSKVLSWFMVRCLKGRYWLVDKAVDYWQKKLKSQYLHGVGDVLGAYYDPEHWNHPNSALLMDVFE